MDYQDPMEELEEQIKSELTITSTKKPESPRQRNGNIQWTLSPMSDKNRNQNKDQSGEFPKVVVFLTTPYIFTRARDASQDHRIYHPSEWASLAGRNGDFRPHINALENLHSKLAERPFAATSEGFDRTKMQKMVSKWTTPEAATSIVQAIMVYQQTTNVQMTGFRTSTIYSFTNNDCSWPVVEWIEDNDTEVLAIFDVEDHVIETGLCSWLMHRGMGINEDKESGRWEKTMISWSVTCLHRLNLLFQAAQHLLGILEWSVVDALALYVQTSSEDCSDETIARYTRLLYSHLSKLKFLETAFDKLAPILEKLISTEG